MKKKSTAVRFNGLFLFSYAAGAIGTTQTIPYLVSMGFEGTQKGIILSGMAISTLVTQFLFGYLSDKFKGCRWFFLISFGVFFHRRRRAVRLPLAAVLVPVGDDLADRRHCPDVAGIRRYVGAADR